MDNRAALVLVIAGTSFLFWLHNTDRLGAVVAAVKGQPGPAAGLGSPGQAVGPVILPPLWGPLDFTKMTTPVFGGGVGIGGK